MRGGQAREECGQEAQSRFTEENKSEKFVPRGWNERFWSLMDR